MNPQLYRGHTYTLTVVNSGHDYRTMSRTWEVNGGPYTSSNQPVSENPQGWNASLPGDDANVIYVTVSPTAPIGTNYYVTYHLSLGGPEYNCVSQLFDVVIPPPFVRFNSKSTLTLSPVLVPPPPPPDASLVAVPPVIYRRQSSVLQYSTGNADSASIDNGIGEVPPDQSGQVVVSPSETTTYTLTANGFGTATAQATVTVQTPTDGYTLRLTRTYPPRPSFAETVPRVTFSVAGGGSSQDAPTGPGASCLFIIGCALDGPALTPVAVLGSRSVEDLFGPVVYDDDYPGPGGDLTVKGRYSGNSLLKALSEARAGGASDVYLVRVGGNTASAPPASGLSVSAVFPGEVYNGATLTVTPGPSSTLIQCRQPRAKGGPFSVRYPSGLTGAQVCARLNADSRNRTFRLSCQGAGCSSAISAAASYTLSGGTYGTLNDDLAGSDRSALFDALTRADGAFDAVDGNGADVLYVPDLYADDDLGSPSLSAVTEVALFCDSQSQYRRPLLAVLGVRPASGLSVADLRSRVSRLVTPNDGYDGPGTANIARAMEAGVPGPYGDDLGRYLSVVAGPDVRFTHPRLGAYTETPAGLYAGLVSSLPPDRPANGLQIPDSVSPAYAYTHRQLNLLNGGIGYESEDSPGGGGAYVTLRRTEDGFRVTDDVTCAARDSAMARLSPVRIVQAAQGMIESACRPYIGARNAATIVAALDGQIEAILSGLSRSGALAGDRGDGYQYRILSGRGGESMMHLDIDLTLRPAGCVHEIQAYISLD